jgi:hypothetical protein
LWGESLGRYGVDFFGKYILYVGNMCRVRAVLLEIWFFTPWPYLTAVYSTLPHYLLAHCFPSFVIPRPGKFFFIKTKAIVPTNLLVNMFPFF